MKSLLLKFSVSKLLRRNTTIILVENSYMFSGKDYTEKNKFN